MNYLLKWLQKSQRKCSGRVQKTSGFTLIELLVAMLMATLVITPLLGFMINIMDSERKEQAKATSEQEIQSALDFIANDLQEAVYIYDATGIAEIKDQLPSSTATNRVLVLVFWKREYKQNVVPVSPLSTVGNCPPAATATSDNCNDAFVYSLVAYYIIKDNDSTWSSAARIGRFEIQDGVRDPGNFNNYLSDEEQDDGFKLFDLNLPGTLQEKMNAWTKGTLAYTKDTLILIDYIDHSKAQSTSIVPAPPGPPAPVNCTSTTSPNAQQVPATGTIVNPLKIYSFYACVDSSRTLARVYLRGNALARIIQGADATYTNSQLPYFPTANVQVKGRGLIGAE